MATIPCIRCGAQIDREFKACPHCGEPLTDFLREYAEKPIDGKYRIVQRLGIGGMGEVFKVEHTFLGSTRVVKIIRAQISSSSDAHERFLREARMATKVQHPNVATLFDFSALPDGSHYMVWEYIEGQNLAQVLKKRGTLAPRHAVRIAIQALAGLEAIHRAGIVHRDISPENLMITQAADGSEFVKIIDLGVAKAAESDVAMTQTGMFVGKFRYASPDHLGFMPAGERIDGRADLYSLGVVLFEMLTGRPPFEATSPHEYIIHHSRDEYASSPDLDRITGNPALQTVLARALDRDRNKRFATAREFSDALAAIESTLPDEPPVVTAPVAFDPDATMKTERTSGGRTIAPSIADAPPTLITPTPQPAPLVPSVTREATVPARPAPPPAPPPHLDAPPTVVDPMPMPPASPSRNTGTIIAVSIIVLLVLGAIGTAGVMVFMKFRNTFGVTTTATTTSTATTTTTTSATAKPSQTSVDVTPPVSVIVDTAKTSATTTTIAPVTTSSAPVVPPPTATHAPVKPRPPVVETAPPVEETPEPEPQPEPEPPSSSVPTFRERGDGNANDAAVATLHQQIGGVTRVALTGGDAEMINELSNALRGRGIVIGEGAPIEIRFTGSVARHGLGRKSRSANATVKKNGRPIFNYVMPREEYRVGDSPAEAFARILTDALSR